MNNICKVGLLLLILGIVFVVISPLLILSGLFTINPGSTMIGGFLMWIGIPLIPIGIILAIVGAITSPKEVYLHNYPHQIQQPQPSPNQPVQPKKIFCPNCGVETNDSVKFCYKCGVKLK